MNTLDSLTDEQRATVYDWLLEMPTKQVVEKVAQLAPEGFGIKTHVTTLRRFKDRRWAELAASRIEAATQLAGIPASQHDTLDTGIQIAIKHHMFERASASNITDDQLAIVSRWSHRQEKLKLEIQRVQIARDRCAQNNLRLQLLARSRNLSFSGGTSSKSPTSTSRDAITPKNAIPAGQETQDTGASPSQSDIGNPKSEINFNPAHPVPLPGLETQSDIRDQKSDMLAPSPDFNSSLITHDSSLRECDHLGPLARNWEDVRRRAQIKFGITPEESARRAELRRTWKNPNSESASAPALTLNPTLNLNPPSQPLNIIDLLKDLEKAFSPLPPVKESETAKSEIKNQQSEILDSHGKGSFHPCPTSVPEENSTPPPRPDDGNTLASADAPC